jgi:hypothetical protein
LNKSQLGNLEESSDNASTRLGSQHGAERTLTSGRTNGELLSLASTGFDVFVTVDKNLAYQQNAATLPIAVVVLDALANDLSSLLPLIPGLERALGSLAPRTLVRVSVDSYQSFK